MPIASDSTSVLTEIAERLEGLSAMDPMPPISAATEIYDDLRIYGDDLDEFLAWIAHRFHVDFSGANMRTYRPDEAGVGLLEMLGLVQRRKYRSLTVQKFLDAIAAGVWLD